MKPDNPIHVRLASREDLPAIGRIYNHYILHSTATFHLEAMTDAQVRDWFTNRSDRHPITAAEWNREVVGWASLSPWRPRPAYGRSVEGSVYVDSAFHRKGIGRALLVDLIHRARDLGHRTLIGGACTEQTASIALQSSLGFREVGTLKAVGCKFGRWLDVTHTQLLL